MIGAQVVPRHGGGAGVQVERIFDGTRHVRIVGRAVVVEEQVLIGEHAREVLAAESVQWIVLDAEVALRTAELPDHIAGGGVVLRDRAEAAPAHHDVPVGVDVERVGMVEVARVGERRRDEVCGCPAVHGVEEQIRASVGRDAEDLVHGYQVARASAVACHVHLVLVVAEQVGCDDAGVFHHEADFVAIRVVRPGDFPHVGDVARGGELGVFTWHRFVACGSAEIDGVVAVRLLLEVADLTVVRKVPVPDQLPGAVEGHGVERAVARGHFAENEAAGKGARGHVHAHVAQRFGKRGRGEVERVGAAEFIAGARFDVDLVVGCWDERRDHDAPRAAAHGCERSRSRFGARCEEPRARGVGAIGVERRYCERAGIGSGPQRQVGDCDGAGRSREIIVVRTRCECEHYDRRQEQRARSAEPLMRGAYSIVHLQHLSDCLIRRGVGNSRAMAHDTRQGWRNMCAMRARARRT